MIRKIYTTLFSFVCAVLTLTSCSDWLDLYPQDEIKKEYLFSKGDGFRTALNGIYRKMSTFDLYGSNLTWGIMDAWAQSYYPDRLPNSGGGKAMEKITKLSFKNLELLPTTNAMWKAAWNVVANCNELAQEAEVADPNLFTYFDWERKMILGEAIGLRAFIQFDMLRIYAPAPASMRDYKTDTRTFIPYVNVYPSYVNSHQTVAYCLEQIIKDLQRAQSIMEEIDENSNFSSDERFKIHGMSDKQFLSCRGYRLNYYAVTAELARVYLYAGMNKEAAVEAKKIIDSDLFTPERSISKFKDGNIKMYDDVIFALYSPTELVDWDHDLNHAHMSGNRALFAGIKKEMVRNIYGDELHADWRFNYQLEEVENNFYRPIKYYKQSESKGLGKINNCLIPMIRLSEMYYIAAEAMFDADEQSRAWAQYYLQLVKYYRGVNKTFYDVNDKNDFLELILSDARREFLGEGQLFYMYKRMNHSIYPFEIGGDNILPIDENMVLPLPESETTI